MECMQEYNIQHEKRKVYNNQLIFSGLNFGLSFVEDKDIREMLRLFYWNWSMAYPDVNYMHAQMQLAIDMSRDYWEDMARTYKYEYDPLVNIDITEERTYTRDSAAQSNGSSKSNSRGTYSEVPYDKDIEKERNQNVSSGSSSSSTDGTSKEIYKETYTKVGDASLRSIPEFIKIERSVLDSLLTNYIYSFKNLFYLDI